MSDVLDVLAKLPPVVLTTLNSNPTQTIAIKRGVMGYYPCALPPEKIAGINAGIKPWQVMAMENGSMFGWEVPAADPDRCRADYDRLPLVREAYDKKVS